MPLRGDLWYNLTLLFNYKHLSNIHPGKRLFEPESIHRAIEDLSSAYERETTKEKGSRLILNSRKTIDCRRLSRETLEISVLQPHFQ